MSAIQRSLAAGGFEAAPGSLVAQQLRPGQPALVQLLADGSDRDLGGPLEPEPKPFVWHKPAAEIIESARRGRATLHQIKSTTDH
jgi:hypothetical protein